MQLNRKSVELLAPAGTWDALVADVESGADAVYLGGKHFNMRVHDDKMNFSDDMLKQAVAYAHENAVKLYVTLNNLISEEELPGLREYISFLEDIKPDALLVQDLAVLKLGHDMGIDIPLHASIMMNTHNEPSIDTLRQYGITRVVISREMPLSELALFKERTGMEIEYFMHGDMCISESGQCIHSGVVFGQSGNRGRCLKPCRWAYKLIDEESGTDVGAAKGDYKLAAKDMCMYRHIPALVQAGVTAFKIEGRMRPPDFLHRIVGTYRKAIDAYIADPCGWQPDEGGWQELYENRARDFMTAFSFGQPDDRSIGFSGQREPRFFSHAVNEASLRDDKILQQEEPIANKPASLSRLSVRVSSPGAALAAMKAGADAIYIGGDVYRPLRPWTLAAIADTIKAAKPYGAKVIVSTPRTTMRRECGELEQFFRAINGLDVKPDGLMVSNLGALHLAQQYTKLPVQADIYFNLFNHLAADFLRDNGLVMAASSLELSFAQLRSLVNNSALPIETVVHGSYESMICDHFFPWLSGVPFDELKNPELLDKHFALRDTAEETHSLRVDQYNRTHILFAKDLCLLPYLAKFSGIASYRIEAQDYPAELVGRVTKAYRSALDTLAAGGEATCRELADLQSQSPRQFGLGTYRFRESKNS